MAYPSTEDLNSALPDAVHVERTIYDEGGQRAVYLVDVDGDTRVLKLMPESGRARAEREVLAGKTFDHPNLARVLDDELLELEIERTAYVYFTEEYIEGCQLAEHQGPLTPCEALQLVADLGSAVKYLWDEHRLVHRDIKPLNIIERGDGTFVLLDIGVARHQTRTTLTRFAGPHQPGSIGYLAPEQLAPLKGREIDYRADLFAIGIVAFEALTGALPFDPEEDSYRTRLNTGLLREADGIPPELEALFDGLLARQPHNRFRFETLEPAIRHAQEALACS